MRSDAFLQGAALSLLCLAAGCSGGSGTTADLQPRVTAPRLESDRTAGSADVLAGELLTSAARVPSAPLRPDFAAGDPALAAALAAIARDHLAVRAFGGGSGSPLVAARRVQRLALEPTAPGDSNGDGSNRDEALQADLGRLAAAAGAALPPGLQPDLLPWREASAAAAAPLPADAVLRPSLWRVSPPAQRTVLLADLAASLQGRVRALGGLLAARRGTLFGATADDGLLGLVLLAEAVAVEEELVAALSTDGSTLGGFADAHTYDPAAGRRWFPAAFAVDGDGAGAIVNARDGASDLDSLAALLDAAAELAWFAGPGNPSTTVQAVFAGPFAPPPPKNPPQPRLNWQNDIRPIIHSQCSGCHLGFATGGFLCDTYTSTLLGSPRTRGLGYTMVIPGNAPASMLHRILTAPPAPIQRMPPGFSPMPAAQIATIDTWINQGALELPEVVPPPPSPGEDLAAICFKNFVALHLDRGTGAVQHRHEGDGGSGVATAAATGRTLLALAHLAAALPDLAHDGLEPGAVLGLVAGWAATTFVAPDGRCIEDVDLATGGPGRAAPLAAHAVLTAGLLEAARITTLPAVRAAADRAATALLTGFRDAGNGWFVGEPAHSFARYEPRALADLLVALRAAVAADTPGARAAHDQLLARLLPTLANASWAGTAGLPLPPAAGGANGRLPLLAGAILVGDAGGPPPATGPITWSQHIRPLLRDKCGNCHFAGAAQGGYRADTVRLLATSGGENGPRPLLVPGDPEGSYLYRKLVDRAPAAGAQMPLQASMLDDRARAMVRAWIQAGATAR